MKYIVKKICTLIITLFIVSLLAFLAFQIIPGDPTTELLGTEATEEARQALRQELGLDRPVLVRYWDWLSGFVMGDMGESYNYRMPNLNAALGMAQFEKLPMLRRKKRELAERYATYFGDRFVKDTDGTSSNYWLNAVLTSDRKEREIFLTETNDAGVMTRPAWTLMNKLEMFKHCETDGLDNAQWLEDRLVNIPSGVKK